MRNTILLIATALSVFGVVVMADQPDKTMKASGAHPGSTAAPGEGTCATSGCHSNATISPGDGVNSFQLGDNSPTYTPGQSYPIKIRAQHAGTHRFGFEVVALDKDNKNVGTWKITESTRTQIINETIDGAKRFYVTHKVAGTKEVSSGVGEWVFNWTAPTTYSDSVKFYYVTNATNNDNTNQGDKLFVSSVAFGASTPNSINDNVIANATISIHPNPASHIVVVRNAVENSTLSIYTSDGKLALPEQKTLNGESRIEIQDLPVGTYFLQVVNPNGMKETKSFVKQ